MSDKGSRSNNSIHSNVNISDRGVRMVNMVMETAVNGGAVGWSDIIKILVGAMGAPALLYGERLRAEGKELFD
jgi:hypothetical protein